MLLYLKNKNKKSPPCMDQDQARETYGRGSLTLWLPATVFFFFFFFNLMPGHYCHFLKFRLDHFFLKKKKT
jgi:hypothetical protein